MHHVVNNDFVKGTLEHIQKLITTPTLGFDKMTNLKISTSGMPMSEK